MKWLILFLRSLLACLSKYFFRRRGVEIIEREDPGWGKRLERGRSFDFEVAFPEVFLGALSFASLEADDLMIILKN